ncbi:LysE family translocator [Actinomadura verrucosospora]|uniref:Lysine exporter LysE/YggA n=1 Tax=Actinomadura verrucosospora TaxID=46165 RepID=A0A7D4A7A7_ACTVE|nr:LysE family translocator [Actinomadura verrucosospora]QKG22807.1 lysine exporter LysE/YggA [Actinomadura verrucosospora]
MAIGSVLAFWSVALLLIAVPGADWAFTIGAGLRGRSVLPVVGGLVTGYAVVTLVVAAGVGALVAGSPILLTALTLVGGAYLVWHGVTTLMRPAAPGPQGVRPEGTEWRIFLRGIGVSGLNPKGLLIFVALLPQFTDPGGRWPVAGQIGALGATFMATCALFYLTLGTLARGALQGRPAAARSIGRLSGTAMAGLGAWLLIDRLFF